MKISFDTDQPFLDITAPENTVEVEARKDGKVLWVNVDGICVLRICQCPGIKIYCE